MTVRECPFRNRLCDRGLPRSSQPVEPVDRGLVEVSRPVFDYVQNSATRPFEATVTVTMPIFGPPCTAEIVEDGRLGCRKFMSGLHH